MLGSLHGKVAGRLDQRVLIETNGVGYWVHTGSWQPEGEIVCYLHHHVREDASDLYGFSDLATLTLFEKLISVSGVGPKAALALLSIGSSERLIQAISFADAGFLTSAPGIGNKVAQKIILELQQKVSQLQVLGLNQTTAPQGAYQDILAALESLGYKAVEVHDVLKKMPSDLPTIDAQIKWALQQLGR